MRVSMYFLHLELTFTPHYIIMDKGLLSALAKQMITSTIGGSLHILAGVAFKQSS